MMMMEVLIILRVAEVDDDAEICADDCSKWALACILDSFELFH